MNSFREAQDVVRTESTLRDLKNILASADVPFLVLKGTHLGAVYYPRPEDRPHQDVDILVRAAHFDQACGALLAGGFWRVGIDPDRQMMERDVYCHGFLGRAGVPVEVHREWAAFGCYPVDAEGVFSRAQKFNFGKTEVLGLSPEDLLVHLCVHMAKSYFVNIERKHLDDVRVLLGRETIDWPTFLSRIRAAHCRVGAYYTLVASRELSGANVPESVRESLRPATWRRWWVGRWVSPLRFPPCSIPRSQMRRIQLRLAWSLLDRPGAWARVLCYFLRRRIDQALHRVPSS